MQDLTPGVVTPERFVLPQSLHYLVGNVTSQRTRTQLAKTVFEALGKNRNVPWMKKKN